HRQPVQVFGEPQLSRVDLGATAGPFLRPREDLVDELPPRLLVLAYICVRGPSPDADAVLARQRDDILAPEPGDGYLPGRADRTGEDAIELLAPVYDGQPYLALALRHRHHQPVDDLGMLVEPPDVVDDEQQRRAAGDLAGERAETVEHGTVVVVGGQRASRLWRHHRLDAGAGRCLARPPDVHLGDHGAQVRGEAVGRAPGLVAERDRDRLEQHLHEVDPA